MKLKLNTVIKNFDGEAIKDETEKELTVAEIFLRALLAPVPEDVKDSGNDRLWKWEISQLIHKNREGDIEIKATEADKLLDRIRMTMPSPAIYGNVHDLIEEAKKKEKSGK